MARTLKQRPGNVLRINNFVMVFPKYPQTRQTLVWTRTIDGKDVEILSRVGLVCPARTSDTLCKRGFYSTIAEIAANDYGKWNALCIEGGFPEYFKPFNFQVMYGSVYIMVVAMEKYNYLLHHPRIHEEQVFDRDFVDTHLKNAYKKAFGKNFFTLSDLVSIATNTKDDDKILLEKHLKILRPNPDQEVTSNLIDRFFDHLRILGNENENSKGRKFGDFVDYMYWRKCDACKEFCTKINTGARAPKTTREAARTANLAYHKSIQEEHGSSEIRTCRMCVQAYPLAEMNLSKNGRWSCKVCKESWVVENRLILIEHSDNKRAQLVYCQGIPHNRCNHGIPQDANCIRHIHTGTSRFDHKDVLKLQGDTCTTFCLCVTNCPFGFPMDGEVLQNTVSEMITRVLSHDNPPEERQIWEAQWQLRVDSVRSVYPQQTDEFLVNVYTSKIWTAFFHLHHMREANYYTGGKKKIGTPKRLANNLKSEEWKKVVLVHAPCHLWLYTMYEMEHFKEAPDKVKLEYRLGKLDMFINKQDKKCAGVIQGKCLCGFDDPNRVMGVFNIIRDRVHNNKYSPVHQTHIDGAKGIHELSTLQDIDSWIVLLNCFECNHIDNIKKNREWLAEHHNTLRKSMNSDGEILCKFCHLFKTMVLGHTTFNNGN